IAVLPVARPDHQLAGAGRSDLWIDLASPLVIVQARGAALRRAVRGEGPRVNIPGVEKIGKVPLVPDYGKLAVGAGGYCRRGAQGWIRVYDELVAVGFAGRAEESRVDLNFAGITRGAGADAVANPDNDEAAVGQRGNRRTDIV